MRNPQPYAFRKELPDSFFGGIIGLAAAIGAKSSFLPADFAGGGGQSIWCAGQMGDKHPFLHTDFTG